MAIIVAGKEKGHGGGWLLVWVRIDKGLEREEIVRVK